MVRSNSNEYLFRDIKWSTIPKPLLFPFQSERGDRKDSLQRSKIVQYIDWNSPGVTGYSFCGMGRDTLIEVIPHRYAKENHKYDIAHVINEDSGRPWWIYMPLDRDEQISELWARTYYRDSNGEKFATALIVSTFVTLSATACLTQTRYAPMQVAASLLVRSQRP